MKQDGQAEGLDLSACEALVSRILANRLIARALRLRAFLRYVVDRSLHEQVTSIPEQEIGEAVFNREPNYDTSVDNIVRVNATELRKRLDQYFQEDGDQEPLILTIPRGSYVPVFSYRAASELRAEATAIFDEAPDEVPTAAVQPAPDAQPAGAELPTANTVPPAAAGPAVPRGDPARAAAVPWILCGCLLLVLAVVCGSFYAMRQRFAYAQAPWRANPTLTRLWSPFFSGSTGVQIVVADTSLAMAKDISGQRVTLDDYTHFRYGGQGAGTPDAGDRAAVSQVLNRDTVSLGDVHTAEQVLLLSPFDPSLKLESARELTPQSVRDGNLVLIGSQQSNPWVELFEDGMNFRLGYDLAAHQAFVSNRAPLPGEQPHYNGPADASHTTGYAVVALLPGLKPGSRTLVLSGTDAQATRAAGDFVTTPANLSRVLDRMPPDTLQPFEVLLRTSQLTGTPLRAEIVAMRVAGH